MTTRTTRRTHRLAAVVVGLALAAAGLAGVPARAGHSPAPATPPDGTGSLEGTELVEEQGFLGHPCFLVTRHVFGLKGAGTFAGRSPAGDPVVYKAELAEGQALHQGPLSIEMENAEPYNHGPNGTHGADSSCNVGTAGTPVQATFAVYAAEVATDTDGDSRVDTLGGAAWVYRLDGTGAKVPCTGTGTYLREGQYGDNWHAEWSLDADCTVVGNAAGTPGEGTAAAFTQLTHLGRHLPCSATCTDNFKVGYDQYLPVEGLAVNLGGPAGAAVGQTVTLTAGVVDDGAPVAGAAVAFTVSGPAPAPVSGAGATGADGRTSFTFTGGAEGDYVVTASATTATRPGEAAAATHTVRFVLGDPSLTMAGLSRAQTEGPVRVKAVLVDRSNPVPGDPSHDPVPGVEVHFTVAGPGTATPSSGTVLTDWGLAVFEFAADRAGTYTVTATASYLGKDLAASHTVALDVATLARVGSVDLPAGELDLASGVIDHEGRYGYFGTARTNPGLVVKVDLATMERVGAITLTAISERVLRAAVIDPAGRYAYFAASGTNPGRIVKIDLETFQRVDALTLPDGEKALTTAVIDPAGRYAYFGTDNGGGVIKIDLATFERVGALTLAEGELQLLSSAIDPAGAYAYFGTLNSNGARVVRVDLATFQRVGAVAPFEGAEEVRSAVIDPAGRYGYFASSGKDLENRSVSGIVKVDLQSFQPVGFLDMPHISVGVDGTFVQGVRPGLGVVDPDGRFAYFGVSIGRDANYPFVAGFIPVSTDWVNIVYGLPRADGVLKVDLSRFELAHVLPLASSENGLSSVVMAPDGSHVYFGTSPFSNPLNPADDVPSKVVKIALTRPPVPWLAAAPDAYPTPYATPLTVPAPGVLANDADTEDGDPLTASDASDPAGGSVALNADGSFTYTPDAGFTGPDTFTYVASDGMDYSAPATVTVTVAPPPSGVASVVASATGYRTNVSLFGGPFSERGPAPVVSLSANASDSPRSAHLEEAEAVYGPATIFRSGPLDVVAAAAIGRDGHATTSARVAGHPDPAQRPGPLLFDAIASDCAASRSGTTAATAVTNGIVETSYHVGDDPNTPEVEEGGQVRTTAAVPPDPAPNTVIEGTLDHVGDRFRITFNRHVTHPDGSTTVTGAWMELLGPTAIGEVEIAKATCGVELSATAATKAVADFDGDGDSDVSVFRPATGAWFAQGQPTAYLGRSGDVPVPGDYDGDGDTDRAVFRPATGAWFVTGAPTAYLGRDGDLPVPGDYDGDGTAERAVFRPSSGGWYRAGAPTVFFGRPGDVPVPADYDGDGDADLAVFRPSSGAWLVQGRPVVYLGRSGDVPVPGDYDGDGDAEVAVFRPATGAWFATGAPTTYLGRSGDVPVPGDYDGDGDAERAVFRPSTGAWFRTGAPTVYLGRSGDVPLPLPVAVQEVAV